MIILWGNTDIHVILALYKRRRSGEKEKNGEITSLEIQGYFEKILINTTLCWFYSDRIIVFSRRHMEYWEK